MQVINRLKALKTLPLNTRGDTIIEVMLAVAILGVALASSYAIASASVQKNRNAQEHAEALQVLNSQIELLRNTPKETQDTLRTSVPFCFDITNGEPVRPVDGRCNVGTDNRYRLSIRYRTVPSDSGIFTMQVDWAGVGNLGDQRERIIYRMHKYEDE